MNFFKKVVLIIAPLMMIGSPTSGYDYFEHLVKEDTKCERCGSRGRGRKFIWCKDGEEINENCSQKKSDKRYKLYSVPYYGNKALCRKCKSEDYSIQVMSLVKTLMPVYDRKKLEELKSDQNLKEQWPKDFDCCGIKGLGEGNTYKTRCYICYNEIDRTAQDAYLCEYCGTGVCKDCEFTMENIKEYGGRLGTVAKNMQSVTCPVCKWGMEKHEKNYYEKSMNYAIDKMIGMGNAEFDRLSSNLSTLAFTNSIIDNAKKSNKNKIYV